MPVVNKGGEVWGGESGVGGWSGGGRGGGEGELGWGGGGGGGGEGGVIRYAC